MTTLVMLMMAQAQVVDVDAIARDTVADLQAKAFDRAAKRFDEKMSEALPAAKLGAVWSQVLAQFGELQRIESVRIEKKGPMQIALVRAVFKKSETAPLPASQGEGALLVISVAVDSRGRVSGLFFKPATPPPSWSPPPYAGEVEEREVTVGALKLPGTLTLPKRGKAPFRAVIFVHGSGPNDRDETVGPNKLFKDLALGLASKGIASLRYEKRTRFAPASLPQRFTMKEEVTDDVRDAVTLLTSTKELDAKHVVVLGHSMGGWLAPRIALDDPRVAGIAIFAGSTRPLDVLVREQMKVVAPGDEDTAAKVEAFSAQFNDPKLAPAAEVDFLGAKLPGSYVLDLRGYDAKKAIAKVKQPVFIAHGARDYQVTQADLDGWKSAVAGRSDVVVQRYARLNHQFIEGEGPSTPAEYQQPGHVPLVVIDELSAWIASLK